MPNAAFCRVRTANRSRWRPRSSTRCFISSNDPVSCSTSASCSRRSGRTSSSRRTTSIKPFRPFGGCWERLPGAHRFIVTEPGRGYRFVAAVTHDLAVGGRSAQAVAARRSDDETAAARTSVVKSGWPLLRSRCRARGLGARGHVGMVVRSRSALGFDCSGYAHPGRRSGSGRAPKFRRSAAAGESKSRAGSSRLRRWDARRDHPSAQQAA